MVLLLVLFHLYLCCVKNTNTTYGDYTMRLTDAKVRTLRLPENKKQLRHSDGSGLYLQITKTGKYWRLNYRFANKQKTLALGVYPSVSLKDARIKTHQAKKLLEQNIDPIQNKKDEKRQLLIESESSTFKSVSSEWLKKKSRQWAKRTFKHKLAELNNHVLPWIGHLKLLDIRALDILSVCQRVENNEHYEQAHRILSLCSQIMRYGIATGRIESDPTRDLLRALAPVPHNHRPCLKDPKAVGELMRSISEYQGTFTVHCALKLSPYIFLRPVELRKLEWSEISFETNTITIPAHKMKMKETHIIPLSHQAVSILKDIHPLTSTGRYVFPGARSNHRPMSDGTINAALRRLGYNTKKEHCAHGFRGTASTLLHESGYNSDVIERQLAHKEGNAVKAAYNHARHLRDRTTMMQQYADYLDKLKDNLAK